MMCHLFSLFSSRYMNFMFDLEDASNDGGIDAEEFSIVCSSYGLDQQECRDAFGKMAQVSLRCWFVLYLICCVLLFYEVLFIGIHSAKESQLK